MEAAVLVTNEGPHAPVRVAGSFVFVSGALSLDEALRPVRDRRGALDAAMRTVEARICAGGARLQDTVKLTYYVTDLSLQREADEQLVELFEEPRPARTIVEVRRLPRDATVEIEATAVLPSLQQVSRRWAAVGTPPR